MKPSNTTKDESACVQTNREFCLRCQTTAFQRESSLKAAAFAERRPGAPLFHQSDQQNT